MTARSLQLVLVAHYDEGPKKLMEAVIDEQEGAAVSVAMVDDTPVIEPQAVMDAVARLLSSLTREEL